MSIIAKLNKPLEQCISFFADFVSEDIKFEYVFASSKFTHKARERRRLRGTNKFPKIKRYIRILNYTDIEKLRNCADIEWAEIEREDEPLYNPTDPQGLDYSWTKQKLTHATNATAFDLEKGDGIVIGIIESAGNGANYTDSEMGGTGNQATDWAAIQTGTHAKFVNYTNPSGQSIDPYGTAHGDGTCRQAISVMDNAVAYCGSCPNGKVMMAVGQGFDQAIQRMADLGVDVISVSYTNVYSHRTAIQYAVAAGVIVVYAHGANSHTELPVPPFEAILVGQFSLTDVSELSYGVGLTIISRGPIGSSESYSTPATAGICGLLLALNPTWNIYDGYSALIQSCQKPAGMAGAVWHLEYGFGITDAYASLQLASVYPLPPIDFSANETAGQVTLTWNILPTTTFNHVEVRRKANSAPIDETDGTLVYSGIGESYIDTLTIYGEFYYAIWGVDNSSNYSLFSTAADFYTKTSVLYEEPPPPPPIQYSYTGKEIKTMPIYVDGFQQVIEVPKKNIITVAKSNAMYSSIQSGINAANPTVHSGTAQAGGVNTITLAITASAVNDFYNGQKVRLTGGTGSGQIRTIIDYDGTTKIATVDSNWTVNPDATTTYAVKSIVTISVYPGEYNEAITLKDCVDVIAVDKESTLITQSTIDLNGIIDNNIPCYCRLIIGVATSEGMGVYIQNANSDVSIEGNIFSRNSYGVRCSNGKLKVLGNIYAVAGGADAALCNNGELTIIGDLTGAGDAAINAAGGITTIKNSIISAPSTRGCFLNGTLKIFDSIIQVTYNNASGHGIVKEAGTLILQNVKIICTHASANSIYATAAQNAYCMGVWANRDDHANITQMITGGFNYDADVA